MTEQTTVETYEIQLPSKGAFYDGKIPDGIVSIRAWTTAEIKLLVSARGKRGDQLDKTIDRVIDSCLRLPPGIRHEELLYTDGFYALISQRIFTYEPHFQAEFKCSECGFKNQIWLNLAEDLDPIELKDGIREPHSVTLPVKKIPVTLRALRRKDASNVAKYKRNKLEKAPMAAEFGDPSYTYRIALQVETVDSEKMSMGEKIPWIDGLHARDLMAIENAIEELTTGVDPAVVKQCQHPDCGEENKFILPMNTEFFRPRSTWPGDDPQDAS